MDRETIAYLQTLIRQMREESHDHDTGKKSFGKEDEILSAMQLE